MSNTMADRYRVSSDVAEMDVAMIHHYLSAESYWASGVDRATVGRSIANSLPFGVFDGDQQIAFARVITDRATFAYLADVFVLSEYRKQGVSRLLMDSIVAHPELQGLRRWLLVTRDAHGLYEKYGFTPLSDPKLLMEKRRANAAVDR
jgi:GNAT superfamily N-acetyltransferase